jgi:hypothetical protein
LVHLRLHHIPSQFYFYYIVRLYIWTFTGVLQFGLYSSTVVNK